ncbi:hypothetical protein Taro_033160 [Colocasia esculenta]|uniref:Uncharacterized protein n=1 Tax=Colocasia esculenta TaxID=4460 RepID=A0A843W3Z5_COLES|nr:hypothetical protein [Colocasia esculenta]
MRAEMCRSDAERPDGHAQLETGRADLLRHPEDDYNCLYVFYFSCYLHKGGTWRSSWKQLEEDLGLTVQSILLCAGAAGCAYAGSGAMSGRASSCADLLLAKELAAGAGCVLVWRREQDQEAVRCAGALAVLASVKALQD